MATLASSFHDSAQQSHPISRTPSPKADEQSPFFIDKSLVSSIAIDATSALLAATAVAPLVTIIDRAVVEASSGHTTLLTSAHHSIKHLLLQPHRFIAHRSFPLMLLLYGSTYFTSNSIDTLYERKTKTPPSDSNSNSNSNSDSTPTSSNGIAKFAAVSAVNMTLSLYKDSQFTRIFGTGAKKALPPASYLALTIRDSLTIFASFNLPPMVAPLLPSDLDRTVSRLAVAQVVVPAMMQPINTPLHLLGLDFYNRGQRLGMRERWGKVRGEWVGASAARMCRVVPPFGFGNVVNRGVRERLNGRVGGG